MEKISAGARMFFMTLRHGKRTGLWKTIPIPPRLPTSGARLIFPEVGCVSPAMILSSVVLPQPLAPTIATNSFGASARDTSSKARTSLAPWWNCFDTRSTVTIGPAAACNLHLHKPAPGRGCRSARGVFQNVDQRSKLLYTFVRHASVRMAERADVRSMTREHGS